MKLLFVARRVVTRGDRRSFWHGGGRWMIGESSGRGRRDEEE